MQIEVGSHTPYARAFICVARSERDRNFTKTRTAYLPAAPDRACCWNDLEASWSFYIQGSVVSNQGSGMIAAVLAAETWRHQRSSRDGFRRLLIGIPDY
jgi:hypothetical protein